MLTQNLTPHDRTVDLAGKSVCVVEDSAIIAFDICMALEDQGADVIGPFATLRDAAATLSDTKPDAAVLDVDLPDGKSFPLASRLRSMDIPVVFYSGSTRPATFERDFPQTSWCTKPLPSERLVATIAASLQ
ncbi:response regulator [Parvularcula sp. LCG005]|uniref:response regulator n=1 Tax=Parvularcula sp. LCG005 TaxID=3078805 RepID=UPI0029432A27|nr:response regulator [Parvularcula sp. LCG005]WOI53902.1 response regulator [Parvularcula sp. LCG005]